ncbi:MAG TPA: hypothetical protein VNL94_10105, partial [Candidatus Binatia bacterium]|nr:hypothetical protein [Candidatus Binatia bacterium]
MSRRSTNAVQATPPQQVAAAEQPGTVEQRIAPGQAAAAQEHPDALLVDEEPLGPPSTDAVELSVGRGVIVEVARLAALEIPDVLAVSRRG